MKANNLIGQKFGRLSVVDGAGVDKWGQTQWVCECDCGNYVIVRSYGLTSGHTTSCGCKKHERFADDITGKRFSRLTVLDFDHMGSHGRAYWLCRCDCGNEIIVRRDGLLSGHTSSCGCYAKMAAIDAVTTHGLSKDPIYTIWKAMRSRCRNNPGKQNHRYGGRGIKVCPEWEDFDNFYYWAINTGYAPGLSIDRIDNDGNYCPENCRWADGITQANNRSTCRYITYNGVTHTVAEWARLFGVHRETLQHRINRNDMRDFEEYYGKEDE